MQYHTCNTIHTIPYMQYHTCNTIHAIPYMQYHTCNTIHAIPYILCMQRAENKDNKIRYIKEGKKKNWG